MRSKLGGKVEGFERRKAWGCIGVEVQVEMESRGFSTARVLRLCKSKDDTVTG